MKRVIVIGSPGSGKSELSRKLHSITGLSLIHLDNIFWNEDKTHVSREEFDEKLKEILKKDSWIIDGSYSRTLEVRVIEADTIFFLDYPLDICLQGAESRVGHKRSDMPWFEETLDPEFKKWIIYFHEHDLFEIRELMDKYKDKKDIIVFKTRKESDEYIEHLKKTKN